MTPSNVRIVMRTAFGRVGLVDPGEFLCSACGMDLGVEIGLRQLRSKKRATVSVITTVAIIGVALGVAALLSVLSVTGGFQEAFREKILGVNAHVLVRKYGVDFHEYRTVADIAEAMPEVKAASPYLIQEMMVTKGTRLKSGVLIKGVMPDAFGSVLDLPRYMTSGTTRALRLPGAKPAIPPRTKRLPGVEDLDEYLLSLWAGPSPTANPTDAAGESPKPARPLPRVHVATLDEADALFEQGLPELPDEDLVVALEDEEPAPLGASGRSNLPRAIVGSGLARELDLHVDDVVTLTSPLSGLDASLWVRDMDVPKGRQFRIQGIFEAGFEEYDSRLIYVDLYEAQSFFNHGDTVNGVEMKLHDIDSATHVARRLEQALSSGPFHTLDWKGLNRPLFSALKTQKVMLSLVIATIILVAAFCVVATLIMMVLEKRKEIAILKAIGFSDMGILRTFFTQGVVVGTVGTLIGLALGAGVVGYLDRFRFPLDPKVYLIDHLPVRVSAAEFGITALVAFVICSSATLFPSLWASQFRPAEGVRHE